ncbi:unnamed protein product [[Candida] boidinii]|nr:unnamed protein product [[Candida] boidinii]
MSSINKSGTRFVPKATQRNRPNVPPKKKITFASDKPDEIENKNDKLENNNNDNKNDESSSSTSTAPISEPTEKRVSVSILKKTNYTQPQQQQQQDQISSINPTGPTPITVSEIIPDTQTSAQYENTPPIITSMPTIKTSTTATTATVSKPTQAPASVPVSVPVSVPAPGTQSVSTKITNTASNSASPPAINNTPSTNKLSDIPISKTNSTLTANNIQNNNKLHGMRGSVSPTSSRRSSVSKDHRLQQEDLLLLSIL